MGHFNGHRIRKGFVPGGERHRIQLAIIDPENRYQRFTSR
jgi:hypothetical protein